MQAQAHTTNEDPQDKKFMTICFVCRDVARPGQEHLRNYGGIVCYSCRAFWRRSHQNSRNPKFVCKKSNQCVLTVATRRRCQKCRYERCLVAGMKPDAVLDMEQKKIRFRKLLKKQQKFLSRHTKGKVAMPTTLRYFPSTCKLGAREGLGSRGASHNNSELQPGFPGDGWMKSSTCYPQTSQISGQSFYPIEAYHQPTPTLMSGSEHFDQKDYSGDYSIMDLTFPRYSPGFCHFSSQSSSPTQFGQGMNAKVMDMTHDFVRVMNRIGCPKTEHLIGKLMTLQSGFFEMLSLSKQEIHFLTSQLSHAFRLFAYTHSEFYEMNHVDQQKLLARNTPLFIQLYMGQFLLVEQRHSPIMADGQAKKNNCIVNLNQRRFLERFNAVTDLFVAEANLDNYGYFISKLRDLPELTGFQQKAIVAYTILFNSDDKMAKRRSHKLNSIFNSYIRTCENCLSLSSLISNLNDMAQFCEKNIEWEICK